MIFNNSLRIQEILEQKRIDLHISMLYTLTNMDESFHRFISSEYLDIHSNFKNGTKQLLVFFSCQATINCNSICVIGKEVMFFEQENNKNIPKQLLSCQTNNDPCGERGNLLFFFSKNAFGWVLPCQTFQVPSAFLEKR